MGIKAVYIWRIDDVDTGQIERGQVDSPIIVAEDQSTIHKVTIRDNQISLDSFDKVTQVATKVATPIDLAYGATKIYMNENYQ